MRISGSGSIEGGKIDDELHVSGSARINGVFECNGIQSSGSLNGVGGLIVHGDIKNSGSLQIDGFLHGDNDAHISGSVTINQDLMLQGKLKVSGSITVRDTATALLGFKSAGSIRVKGDLISDRTVDLDGSGKIYGNVRAQEVLIGTHQLLMIYPKRILVRIVGSILALDKVDISRTRVNGDVIGRDVRIGKHSNIQGTVYYVNMIETNKAAKLNNEPVKINEEELLKMNER
jgi:cytoskeletal protein CcmA (bactofilin family)